ncbi:MAG: tetratricopeptide repeat protein [Candidatus Firestonebacteria bacterium]
MKEEEITKLLNEAEGVLQKGDSDGALALYEEITAKDPNNAEAHSKLAELYSEKGQKEKASKEFLLLGGAYYESRLFKNALKYFQKVLEIDPSQIEARIKSAEIYVNQEMEREAKLEYLAIAEHYLSENKLNEAEEFSGKAIELKSIEAHYITGLVHYARAMWKEAAQELEILIKIKVNHIGAHIHLASCYTNMSKAQLAISTLEKVLKIEPKNPDIFRGLGDAYAKKGSLAEAVNNYGKAIAILETTDLDAAASVSETLVANCPGMAEAHQKHSNILEKKGLYKEAAESCKLAAELFTKAKNLTAAKQLTEKAAYLSVRDSGPAAESEKKPEQTVEKATEPIKFERKPEPKSSFTGDIIIEKSTSSVQSKSEYNQKPRLEDIDLPPVTPVSEKGTVEEMFGQAEKHMKDAFFEKAIEIYRLILRKEPRNTTVRTKLHQAYLLLAQQEDDISKVQEKTLPVKPNSAGPVQKKEKKSKISYL